MKKETKKKVGRPLKVESPEKLMELFKEFEKSKKGILTIVGFQLFMSERLETHINTEYWYDLSEDFSQTKKIIEQLMEERYIELSIDKENATSFLIFYGKNKFNYTDKQVIDQTTINLVTVVENEEVDSKLEE